MDNLPTVVCLCSPIVTVTLVALGPSWAVTLSVTQRVLFASLGPVALVLLRHNLVIVKDERVSLVAEILTLFVAETCWAGTVIFSSVDLSVTHKTICSDYTLKTSDMHIDTYY